MTQLRSFSNRLTLQDTDFIEDVASDIRDFVKNQSGKRVLVFPPFNNFRRFLIHQLVEHQFDTLKSFSIGEGDSRRTVICFDKDFKLQCPGSQSAVGPSSANQLKPKSRIQTSSPDSTCSENTNSGNNSISNSNIKRIKREKVMPSVNIYRPPAARKLEQTANLANLHSHSHHTRDMVVGGTSPDKGKVLRCSEEPKDVNPTAGICRRKDVNGISVFRNAISSIRTQNKVPSSCKITESTISTNKKSETVLPSVNKLEESVKSKQRKPDIQVYVPKGRRSAPAVVSNECNGLPPSNNVNGSSPSVNGHDIKSCVHLSVDSMKEEVVEEEVESKEVIKEVVQDVVKKVATDVTQEKIAEKALDTVTYKTEDKAVSKPIDKSEDKVVSKPVDKSDDKVVSKPIDKSENEIIDKPVDKAGNELMEKVTKDKSPVEVKAKKTAVSITTGPKPEVPECDNQSSAKTNETVSNQTNADLPKTNGVFVSGADCLVKDKRSVRTGNEKAKQIHLNPEECDWESMFDDTGECLDPSLLEQLTSAVGDVTIETPKSAYNDFKTKSLDVMADEFPHVIEIYNFPPEFQLQDLMTVFSQFKNSGFEIKWVDETHALGIFSSSAVVSEVLSFYHPFVKTRSLREGTPLSKMKARRSAEFMLPYKPRPDTCPALARRLVTGALGVKLKTSREEREAEKKILTKAREKKKLEAKQKEDAWEGTFS